MEVSEELFSAVLGDIGRASVFVLLEMLEKYTIVWGSNIVKPIEHLKRLKDKYLK